MILNKPSSVLTVLVVLTLLSIFAQLSLFIIHSHGVELVDELIRSSLSLNLFHFVVLIPILKFIAIQVMAYVLLIGLLWFLALSCGEFFSISAYGLSIFLWFIVNLCIFTFNAHFFPDSFFAGWLQNTVYNDFCLSLSVTILLLALSLAYYQFFRYRSHLLLGSLFLSLALITVLAVGLSHFKGSALVLPPSAKPNIIMIGLDSVRPDFTGFYGRSLAKTPAIDAFLRSSVSFSDSYTPLARTFPTWLSILTGKHPKHNHARINLDYSKPLLEQDTLAKVLKQAGYETIYATDEKRFSNISADFGFDQIWGPEMGLSDFILGGLSDFPLTNLMINLPLGRFLFPYNYGNRAAAITYEPDKFLELLKIGLHQRSEKPLFLAIHFCVTHWPFTWAADQQAANLTLDQRYKSSIERVDRQLGELLALLKERGLLENSLVILLSDHGTTLGLPGDRLIDKKNYQGQEQRLHWLTINRFNKTDPHSIDFKKDYSLNTSYGQGTDILSLKQYRVVLAFKGYGFHFNPHSVSIRASLLDLAPTILAFLNLPPMASMDGLSLLPAIYQQPLEMLNSRPFYLETGYSASQIETDRIKVDKVIKQSLGIFQINPQTGYLFVKPSAEKDVIANKQRALLLGPWLLARYPASQRSTLVKEYILPPYYVLANLQTGQWTIGFDSDLARKAPLKELRKQFLAFYGDEL